MGDAGQHREGSGPEGEPAEQEGIEPIDPEQVARAAAEITRENPHTTLAGAFAIGFVLGGGLTPRLLGSLLIVVGRRYAAEMARESLCSALRQRIDEVAAH
jgi:hypothetical protein